MKLDTGSDWEENLSVVGSGRSRRQIARVLNAAYGDGLLSEETLSRRLDQLFTGRVISPKRLIGDLSFRASNRRGARLVASPPTSRSVAA